MKKYHYLYKIINLVDGKYYIGVHSTNNLEDGYMGSGTHIKRAIEKYGIKNFKKEILEFFESAEEKWLAEIKHVTIDVSRDKNSYNQAPGGKNWIAAMKRENDPNFNNHQSKAGKMGGKKMLSYLDENQKKEWHSKGGASSAKKTLMNKTGIFSEEAIKKRKSAVSKAIKGTIELWHPEAPNHVKNRNSKEYVQGWSVRVKPDSEKYHELKNSGYVERNSKDQSDGQIEFEKL
jgi:glycine cleavage system H lipoate-binding protein